MATQGMDDVEPRVAGVDPLAPPFDPQRRKRYDAFISYSHAGDGDLAPAVQRGLQQLAKPMLARRALEVFRDDTGLAVNSELWASICEAMDGASYLVLFASPRAAQSRWVGHEIARWVATKGADTILPVVTDGTWTWDEAAGDLDLAASTAAHPALAGVFASEPRPLFLDRTDDPRRLSLKDDAFRDGIAQLAARIHGVPKEDLESEELRIQRRTRRLARGALTGLVLLTLTSLAGAVLAVAGQREAVAQRDIAEAESRVTRSQALAGDVLSSRAAPADLRLLLAAHASALAPTSQAADALLQVLLDERETAVLLPGHTGGAIDVVFASDGAHVTTVDAAGRARVWELASGRLRTGPVDVQAVQARLSADGRLLVTVDRGGTVRWLDADTGEPHRTVEAGDRPLSAVCTSWACDVPVATIHPDGELVALGTVDGHVRFVTVDGEVRDHAIAHQVTGVVLHPDGRVFVSDLDGVEQWTLDGPGGGPGRVHTWFQGSAMLPALVGLDASGQEIVVVEPSGDDLTLVNRYDLRDGGWEWRGGIDTSHTADRGADLLPQGERIGAIAVEGSQLFGTHVLVGTEPRAYEVDPARLLSFNEIGDRTVLTDRLGAPLGAVTRIDVHPDGLVAVASRSEVVRISGLAGDRPDGIVAIQDGTVADQLAVPAGPAPPDGIVDERATLETALLPDGRWAVLDASDRVLVELEHAPWGVGSAVLSGGVRIVGPGGDDVTPDVIRELDDVTALAVDRGGRLVLGDRYGRVRVQDPDAAPAPARQVSTSPILSVRPSADGRWLLVRTGEELLLGAGDATTARALVSLRERSPLRTAPPLYLTPSMAALGAGWDDAGNVRLGWLAETGIVGPAVGQAPFGGEVTEVVVPQLPGIPSGAFSTVPVHVEVRLDDLLPRACMLANRELSAAERRDHLGDATAPLACPGQQPADDTPVALLARRLG